MYSLGIDISSYQQSVVWNDFEKSPITIGTNSYLVSTVIIKAGEGNLIVDPMCVRHAQNAKSVNMQVGYYWFCRPYNIPSIQLSAQAQAQLFAKTLRMLPSNDLPLILDLEVNDINLNPTDYLNWADAFIQELKELTGQGNFTIYGSPYWLNTHLPLTHDLGQYGLWVAEYNCYENQIHIPNGWSEWLYWQFSQTGTTPAIQGNCDLSFIRSALV